jgi:hypothetical protein
MGTQLVSDHVAVLLLFVALCVMPALWCVWSLMNVYIIKTVRTDDGDSRWWISMPIWQAVAVIAAAVAFGWAL